VRRRAPTSQ